MVRWYHTDFRLQYPAPYPLSPIRYPLYLIPYINNFLITLSLSPYFLPHTGMNVAGSA